MSDFLKLLFGGFLATAGGFLSHLWSENREFRKKQYELRLNLYLDIIQISVAHHKNIHDPDQDASGRTLIEYIHNTARLQLLGSKEVADAYNEYFDAVQEEMLLKPPDRDSGMLIEPRAALIDAMEKDFRGSSQPLALIQDWIRRRESVANTGPGSASMAE